MCYTYQIPAILLYFRRRKDNWTKLLKSSDRGRGRTVSCVASSAGCRAAFCWGRECLQVLDALSHGFLLLSRSNSRDNGRCNPVCHVLLLETTANVFTFHVVVLDESKRYLAMASAFTSNVAHKNNIKWWVLQLSRCMRKWLHDKAWCYLTGSKSFTRNDKRLTKRRVTAL